MWRCSLKIGYFCNVYELRELYAYYLGLFLLSVLVLLAVFRHANLSRYRSMIYFWLRTSSSEEFNKPFTVNRAFSWTGFIFRALIFGSILQVYIEKSLSPLVFGPKIVWWSFAFILFWGIKTLIEGGLGAMLGYRDGLLKIFYIRAVFKEKIAFFYCCLLILLIFLPISSLGAKLLAYSYALALVLTHLRFLKLYFRKNSHKKVLIITYICAFEIVPVWLLIQMLKL